MKKTLNTVVLALACAAAEAHEADWVYFPMYPRDTAHAVHLTALKFRPDGLLSAATRYPRHSGESWTPQESALAWYNYAERLIDCETGQHVDTREALLGEDMQEIASHAVPLSEGATRLSRQWEESRNEQWPSARSEILLACLAASSPTLKAQRARAAKAAPPLLSDEPLTRALVAETSTLFANVAMHYDLSSLAKRPPAHAHALFEQLRQQYVAWRQSIDGAYRPAPPKAGAPSKALDALLDEASELPGTLRVVSGDVIEYEEGWDVGWGIRPPPAAANARLATQTVRKDCESGLRVVTARHWRDVQGRALVSKPLLPKEAVAEFKQQLVWAADTGAMARWGGAYNETSPCGMVRAARRQLAPGAALAGSLDEAALAAEKTPAAMLLKIRAALRAEKE